MSEQAAEEQDLGDEEDPHAELGGVVLLLGIVELMRVGGWCQRLVQPTPLLVRTRRAGQPTDNLGLLAGVVVRLLGDDRRADEVLRRRRRRRLPLEAGRAPRVRAGDAP